MTVSIERARAAKSVIASRLDGRAEVNGIGIAPVDGGYGVKVNLAHPLPEHVIIPEDVDGVRILVDEIGEIRPRR